MVSDTGVNSLDGGRPQRRPADNSDHHPHITDSFHLSPSPLQCTPPPLNLSIQLPIYFTTCTQTNQVKGTGRELTLSPHSPDILIHFQKKFTNVVELSHVGRVQRAYLHIPISQPLHIHHQSPYLLPQCILPIAGSLYTYST